MKRIKIAIFTISAIILSLSIYWAITPRTPKLDYAFLRGEKPCYYGESNLISLGYSLSGPADVGYADFHVMEFTFKGDLNQMTKEMDIELKKFRGERDMPPNTRFFFGSWIFHQTESTWLMPSGENITIAKGKFDPATAKLLDAPGWLTVEVAYEVPETPFQTAWKWIRRFF